jgi:hypothetical protein
LQVAADSHVVSEIVRLRDSIGREIAAVQIALNDHTSASAGGRPRWGRAEHEELRRQLGALDQHVAQAPARSQDPPELRAEFATLLCFAKTLRIDAESWRAAYEAGLRELEREERAARKERERLTLERATLMSRRDALQSTIDETAGRIAQQNGCDCRNTLPIFRLGEALTVCSVVVLSATSWFRPRPDWLVTLNDACDHVRVTRSY